MEIRAHRSKAALLCAAALTATACGSAASVPLDPGPGILACGAALPAAARPTSHSDPIQLSIPKVTAAGNSVAVRYELSSAHPREGIPVPIHPVAPTAFIAHGGIVVAVETTPAPPRHSISDLPLLYWVLSRPYEAQVTITSVCPGSTWSSIRRNLGRYTAGILMSRQPAPVTGADTGLIKATIPLRG